MALRPALLLALGFTLTLAAGSAAAGEEAPVGTAPRGSQFVDPTAAAPAAAPTREPPTEATLGDDGSHLTTSQQIQAWIAEAPKTRGEIPDVDDGPTAVLDDAGSERRQVHGEIRGTIGTGGYRAWGLTSVIPVGKTGTMVIDLERSHDDGRRRYR